MNTERGMVLLLSLFVVVILSTLAFSAAQQTQLTSMRVRHDMDVGLARLAAQRAVIAQMLDLERLPDTSFTPQGDAGLYRVEAFTAPSIWARASTWQTGRCRPAARVLERSAGPACTIVELLRFRSEPDYRAFRVTARGVGARIETTAFVQAYTVLSP